MVSASDGMKAIGKPYEGELHVRFDVAGNGTQDMERLVRHSQRKRRATDRRHLSRWRHSLTLLVIGIAGPKEDAEITKAKVQKFLTSELALELSGEKTLITHLENKIPFLGYEFSKWNRTRVKRVEYRNSKHPRLKRTLSGEIKLEVPKSKLKAYAKKQGYGCLDTHQSIHLGKLVNNSEIEILYTYNAELRGLANFYCLANNYHHLGQLFHLAHYSFLKSLASKRQSSVRKVAASLKGYIQGEFCLLVRNKKGERRPHKLVRLKHLPKVKGALRADSPGIDDMVNTMRYASQTELEQRLMANRCEACGKTEGIMEVHHVRKLKDLKKKPYLGWLDRLMIERVRKTLVLCYGCHHIHHEKQIPINQLESGIH